MKPENALLLDAIEDNIAWCSTICWSHHSGERNSESAWVNLAPSPLLYPNIITRRRNCQAEIVRLVIEIVAGCISFSSGTVTGLSNWFSKRAEQVFDLGIMHPVAGTAPGGSIVFWAAEDDAAFQRDGFRPLGALRVWMTEPVST